MGISTKGPGAENELKAVTIDKAECNCGSANTPVTMELCFHNITREPYNGHVETLTILMRSDQLRTLNKNK